jgi:dUTP pyrophosphatase
MSTDEKTYNYYCSGCPTLEVKRVHPDAVLPTRAHDLDLGYDLTAISLKKMYTERTFLFDTGLRIRPPEGYYIEILPRSSLSKTGYVLANSVGTIDVGYRGNLYIALTKVDMSCPDLVAPFTKVQLVLRRANFYNVKEVETLDETVRGDGGFGSTDQTN